MQFIKTLKRSLIFSGWEILRSASSVFITVWKVSKYGVFSGPYFPVFGLTAFTLHFFIKVYRYSDFFSIAMLSLSLKLVYWTKSNTKVPKKLSYIILMGVSHYQNKMHSNNVSTIIEYFFVIWTLLKTHFRLQILVKSNDSLGALPAFTIL